MLSTVIKLEPLVDCIYNIFSIHVYTQCLNHCFLKTCLTLCQIFEMLKIKCEMKNYKLTIFPSLKDNDLTHAIFSRWVVKSASMGAIWGNSSAAYLKKNKFYTFKKTNNEKHHHFRVFNTYNVTVNQMKIFPKTITLWE